ncbi:hypothetical protein PHYSODRAFT_560955 [Phytophthora sojae]|uniref:DUF659 domain-containing protein n=1 Tax=Phytophthora sojae (strain P6497) TaxID=1094619 RepID=G4ZQA1_PHYSP|nr:hypothetical protein PHYSODRAFT_560955 [Phytophthora sojae]EGZ14812.1 hypothetical protein PHYSODRAFT_560955 [Phytophthora sojae]|eukprot:XP_009528561.1 hypothetical protein PHYSODRAFT_560955 [Phytophthora sojae]
MVVAPGMPSLFWSSWSTRSEQHTAAYLVGEIDKVISDIESATTAHVVSVVTDNARNMSSARSHIQARRPNVVSGGCSAHVLNLLMQDVCRFPVIQAVRSRAVAVTRFVRDHLALLDEFKALQQGLRDTGLSTRNLVLPVPTGWYSVFACLRSLVRDNSFWDSLRTIVRLLDPIIEALRQLEGDNVFVSGGYKWFRWLRYHTAYGVTSPEQDDEEAVDVPEPSEQAGVPGPSEHEAVDQARNGIELLSNSVDLLAPTNSAGSPPTAPAELQSVPASETSPESTSPDDENLLAGGNYRRIDVPQLDELQEFFRDKIRSR